MATTDGFIQLLPCDSKASERGTAVQIEHVERTFHGTLPASGDAPSGCLARDIETVALVVKEPKADFELNPIILDEVRENEVLVDMKYSGICEYQVITHLLEIGRGLQSCQAIQT